MRTRIIHFCFFMFIATFSLVLNSCNKSDINKSISDPLKIEGIITGANGIPIQNVEIKAGSVTTTTDANGHFLANNAVFNTAEIFVTATKSGYFTGSRTLFVKSGSNNFLKIQLLPRTETAALNAASGGNVIVGNANINFPANAFATTDGNAYTGTVSVKAAYLDPLHPATRLQMPGALRGINTSGNLQGLKTFGMMKVELETPTGQKLQLKTGSSAQLKFPIPASMMAQANSTIPLWYFDEGTGLWKEEGSATKNGNFYTGVVTHFTFWNVDDPYQYARIEMRIVNQLQQGIQGAGVQLTSLIDSTSSFDYTDASGFVNGFVPVNVPLKRDVYNECDQIIFSDVIGPFTSTTNVGTLQITSLTNQQTITGTVTNCTSLPVVSGYVIINMPGRTLYANVSNGIFTTTFTSCSSLPFNASIVAVDSATREQGNPVTVSINTSVVNAGTFIACGVSGQEFLTISVDGVSRIWNQLLPYVLYAEEDSVINGGFYDLFLGAYNSNNGGSVDLQLFRSVDSTIIPFNVGIRSLSIYSDLAAPNMIGDYFLYNIIQPARLTEYGAVGQFISGSFSGLFIQNRPSFVDTVNVITSFRIRRN